MISVHFGYSQAASFAGRQKTLTTFTISPNPTRGSNIVISELPDEPIQSLQLYTFAGQLIFSQQPPGRKPFDHTLHLNISKVSLENHQTYLLAVITENGTYIKQFVFSEK